MLYYHLSGYLSVCVCEYIYIYVVYIYIRMYKSKMKESDNVTTRNVKDACHLKSGVVTIGKAE